MSILGSLFGGGDSAPEHPGELNAVERMMAMGKHVVGKALKWAAVGALIGAVLFAIPGLGAGGLLASVTGGAVGKGLMGAGLDAALTGATYIGGLAAVVGGLIGVSGASEAADVAQEESMFAVNRRETRQTQQQMLQQQYQEQQVAMAQQAQGLGIKPNVDFNKGKGESSMLGSIFS